MRASDLKHRITILREQKTPDTYGGFTVTWAEGGTVWAAIWPLKATERLSAMQQAGEVTHRIRIRYRTDITNNMRFRHKGKTYHIVGAPINFEMENTYLELLCKEVQ